MPETYEVADMLLDEALQQWYDDMDSTPAIVRWWRRNPLAAARTVCLLIGLLLLLSLVVSQ